MGDWLQDRCNSIQKAQQEHIQKSFGSEDIEKARAGVYAFNKKNVKAGIAGTKFGTKKEDLEGGYNAEEHKITDPKKVLERTKELNKLKKKRSGFVKDSYAYNQLDKQIKKYEESKITDKDGNTIAWKKFDDE